MFDLEEIKQCDNLYGIIEYLPNILYKKNALTWLELSIISVTNFLQRIKSLSAQQFSLIIDKPISFSLWVAYRLGSAVLVRNNCCTIPGAYKAVSQYCSFSPNRYNRPKSFSSLLSLLQELPYTQIISDPIVHECSFPISLRTINLVSYLPRVFC